MVTAAEFDRSWRELGALADALEALAVSPSPEAAISGEIHERTIRTLRSYLIPRIRDPEQPMLVVFAGPTGAGKSTLLNSVAGRDLTATGPIRPTTIAPVVFVSDVAASAYRNIGGVECEIVEGHAPILSEMALVDTPDIDSTSLEHRVMAEILIDHADVVVFVSSALRYADLVPWEVLRRAGSRGAPVVNVLNRIRADSGGAFFDYMSKLRAEGLNTDAVAIHEHHMRLGSQSVPSEAVRELRRRLVEHFGARGEQAKETFGDVLSSTAVQVGEVIESARHALEQSKRASRRAEEVFRPESGDLTLRLEPHWAGFDLESILALDGKSRRRVNRWKRRHAPTQGLVASARSRLVDRIVFSLEADLSRKLRDVDDNPPALSDATFEILLFTVQRWARSVDKFVGNYVGRFHALTVLLVMASVVGKNTQFAEAAGILMPTGTAAATIEKARNALEDAVEDVCGGVLRQVVDGLRREAPTQGQVDAVSALLSAVIARSSFAHA